MNVIRDHRLLSGLIYETPLAQLPALTHCGEAVAAARHFVEPHQHVGFELMYLARGSYTWSFHGKPLYQKTGDLVIAFPGQVHGSDPAPHPETHQLWMGLKLSDLGAEARQLGRRLQAMRGHLLPQCQDIEPVLRGIVRQVISTARSRQAVVESFLQLLVRLIDQELDQAGQGAGEPRMAYPLLKAISLLRENLDRRLSLADMAAVAGCSVSQLCKEFRRELHCSPGEYHLRLRLEAAREALRVPETSISQVAYAYGFSSSQHFSARFSTCFGVTPRQWQAGDEGERSEG